jgi:hypothetical protein
MKSLGVRYLESRMLADGTIAFYYVPPKPARKANILETQPLGTDPVKAVARAEELNRILDAWRTQTAPQDAEMIKGTVSWLAREFRKSAKYYTSKGKKTQRFYDQNLKVLENFKLKSGRRLGDVLANQIKPKHADKIYEELQEIDPETKRPKKLRKSNAVMQTARRLFNFGIRQEVVQTNPFSKMGLTANPERHIIWAVDQLNKFIDASITADRRSIGLTALMCYELCQREGDMLSITWNRYKDGTIYVRQGKTNTLVPVPVSDELRVMLDSTARREGVSPDEDFIVWSEPTQEPYEERYFRELVSEIRAAANLPKDLWIMDLRRTGLTELGDSGATEDEIMSVSGHLDRAVVRRYVNKTKTQAINAIRKRTISRRAQASANAQADRDVCQEPLTMAVVERLSDSHSA